MMRPPSFIFGPTGEMDLGNALAGMPEGKPPLEVRLAGRFRLQNKAALTQILGLPASTDDADVILHAWRRWGCDLSNHLRGAFAFVIYDQAADTIYAARDALGQEPLFLAADGNQWIFADHPGKLRAALSTPPPIDHLKVADFLTDRVVERDRTYFVGIERLPAGHWTTITAAGRQTIEYWSVSRAPKGSSEEQPASRFRKLFDRSVAFHAQGNSDIGVFVSGGMDSSSVLASLVSGRQAGINVQGLTRSYHDLPVWSDGQYVELLKQRFQFDHYEAPSTSINPLDEAEKIIAANDGPVQGYGFAASVPLYRFAQQQGITTILDGHGGDEVVSLGMGLLNELAQNGQWLRLWAATEAPAKMFGGSRLRLLARYFVHIAAYRTMRDLLRKISRKSNGAKTASILAPELDRLVSQARYKTDNPFSWRNHTERDLHEFALGSPIQQYAQEALVLAGRAYGIEIRMPFLDRDLAEFSLSLKAETKLKNGLTRVILREAMADSLPKALLERPDKFSFADAFATGLMEDRERLLELTDPTKNALGSFVNVVHLQEIRQLIMAEPENLDGNTARELFRIAQLSIWLGSLGGMQGKTLR